MAHVRVISDSSCDLPEEIVRRLDIEIVSLSIRFGDEEFIDRDLALIEGRHDRVQFAGRLVPITAHTHEAPFFSLVSTA